MKLLIRVRDSEDGTSFEIPLFLSMHFNLSLFTASHFPTEVGMDILRLNKSMTIAVPKNGSTVDAEEFSPALQSRLGHLSNPGVFRIQTTAGHTWAGNDAETDQRRRTLVIVTSDHMSSVAIQ